LNYILSVMAHHSGAKTRAGSRPLQAHQRQLRPWLRGCAAAGAGDALSKRIRPWDWDCPPAKRVTVSPSRPRPPSCTSSWKARDERRLRALQKHLNTVKLLIVDELGYVPFTAVGSELLFEVFSQRYERGNGHPYSVRNGSLAHCSTALPIMSTFWR
jgi:IstB-like ATP binding protein